MTDSTQPARRLARHGCVAVTLTAICMGKSAPVSAQNGVAAARAGAAHWRGHLA